MMLANLSDEELLSSLASICFETRRLLGRLLLHLIEVEDRRLDLRSACSSLYDFCQRRLGMSESEAVRRIEAARLVKRFPALLGHLERGDIHLTGLLLLREYLTEQNFEALISAARGKSKREIQDLIAAMSPRSDVFATVTELTSPAASAQGIRSGEATPQPSPAHSPAHVAPEVAPRAKVEP